MRPCAYTFLAYLGSGAPRLGLQALPPAARPPSPPARNPPAQTKKKRSRLSSKNREAQVYASALRAFFSPSPLLFRAFLLLATYYIYFYCATSHHKLVKKRPPCTAV